VRDEGIAPIAAFHFVIMATDLQSAKWGIARIQVYGINFEKSREIIMPHQFKWFLNRHLYGKGTI
jgi:hypothetical protein